MAARSKAGSRLSRLAIGSPMPITTILLSRSSSGKSRCKCNICSTISPVVKLRTRPSRPLAQKAQPMAQPTWVLMQMVRCPRASRNSTHSTCWPSANCRSSFSVPSSAVRRVLIVEVKIWHSLANSARRSSGRSVISSKPTARRCMIHCITCAARNLGSPRSTNHSCRSFVVSSKRFNTVNLVLPVCYPECTFSLYKRRPRPRNPLQTRTSAPRRTNSNWRPRVFQCRPG